MPDGNPLVDDLNQRIVQRLAEGKTPIEIGAALYMTPAAVRGRLDRLRLRFAVSTNAQLIALALRRGWIS